MASWFHIPARIAMVMLGMIMLVAFAPSSASAHGSHVHPSAVMHVDTPSISDAGASAEKRIVEVSAALASMDADHVGHSGCGDRGCCANGHCGSFCGVIAPSLFSVFGVVAASLERVGNASPPIGLATDGPARPPKSFA